MKTMKITTTYNVKGIFRECTVKCPYLDLDKFILIGTDRCQKCDFFISIDQDKKIVTCEPTQGGGFGIRLF